MIKILYLLIFLLSGLAAAAPTELKKATINVQLVETTAALADHFVDTLSHATKQQNVRAMQDSIALLNGIVAEGDRAKSLGHFVFEEVDNQEIYAQHRDETLELDKREVPLGLHARLAATVLDDRSAYVFVASEHLELSPEGGIEKSWTIAAGITRLYAGWPLPVFRWDQGHHTRLLILTMEAPPTSRSLSAPGEDTELIFSLYQKDEDGKKQLTKQDVKPFRITSEGIIINRFTANIHDHRLFYYADGYYLARRPERQWGYYMLMNVSPLRARLPWYKIKDYQLPEAVDDFIEDEETPPQFPLLNGSVRYFEPIERYVNPPFQRGRYPDKDEILRRSILLSDRPLKPTVIPFESTRDSPRDYTLKISSKKRHAPTPIK